MALPPRPRVVFHEVALACLAVGLFSFAASDALAAYAASWNLEAARGAVETQGWRVVIGMPDLPVHRAFDAAGSAGFILLVALALARSVPPERRASVHAALAFLAIGVAVSFARAFVDRGHAREAVWGAIQLGLVSAAVASLAWTRTAAKLFALVGGVLLTLRQPAIWHASDAFVHATGDPALAYGAELWTVTAHVIGAAGAGLLSLALVVALLAPPRAQTTSASGSTRASL